MDKKFFEVFPNLKVDGNVREWLEAAFVTRVWGMSVNASMVRI